MKTDKSKEVNYYVTYLDNEGHEHYAVQKYNRLSGEVTIMKDYK